MTGIKKDETSSGANRVEVTRVAERPSFFLSAVDSQRLDSGLRWLLAIRLVVVTSITIPYLLLQLSQGYPPTFDLLYLLSGLTYLASLIYLLLFRLLKKRLIFHAYLQFAGDLGLVTGLVYFFGGTSSFFSILYLVVIMVAATLLHYRGGLLVAGLAYLCYASLILAITRGWLIPPGDLWTPEDFSWRIPYNLAVHLFGFFAVAILTSYLASQVSRAEEQIEAQRHQIASLEQLHRDIVQSIPTGLIATDANGRTTWANRAACEILRAPEAQLLHKTLTDLGFLEPHEEALLASGSLHPPLRRERELTTGSFTVPVGFTLSPLTASDAERVGWILVFQDLTAWKRLQEELRIKDRMAAIGELAAGIAHEIGNPLAAISGSVQLLASAVPATEDQSRLLEIILRESQRLDRTIKGFLRFSRPRERSVKRFDVAQLIAENMSLLQHGEGQAGNLKIELDLHPSSVEILADPDQISQVFWNLARNALKAMPSGGTLRVRGRIRNGYFRLEVQDTGHGMTEEQRARVFQPFQSFFDHGTGIGMAIVYRIIEEHKGRIEVDSQPGAGTTVAVELPLAAQTPMAELLP